MAQDLFRLQFDDKRGWKMRWLFFILLLVVLYTITGCWGIPDWLSQDIQPPSPEEMIGWVNYPDVFPTCMTDDLKGNIWIGGEVEGSQGLFRFNGETWQRIPASEIGITEPVVVTDVYGADNGKVYVGFKDKGFAIYDGTMWKVYNKRSGLVSDSVTVVRIDKSSKIWVGTVAGLMRHDGTKWDTFTIDAGLPDNHISTLEVDRDNKVICITAKGYALYNSETDLWISCSPIPPDSEYTGYSFFYDLNCDKNEIIWTNHFERTEDYLIFWKFIINNWQKVEIAYLGYSPYEFAFDVNNNLWFVPNRGVVKYTYNSYIEYHSYKSSIYNSGVGNSGLLDEYITGIYIDRDNNKWFFTLSGLSKFELD